MPSEVIRCSDCGATFKAVPAWLRTAKVKFTCTNCPKRPSRAVARFEPAPEPPAALTADPDAPDGDPEGMELEDIEDAGEAEDVGEVEDVPVDEPDEPTDDKNL